VSKSHRIDVTPTKLSFARDIGGGGQSYDLRGGPQAKDSNGGRGEDGYGRKTDHQEQETVEDFNRAEAGVEGSDNKPYHLFRLRISKRHKDRQMRRGD
jgi:hypothetical protein